MKTAILPPPEAWNMTCPLGLSSLVYKIIIIKKCSYLISKDLGTGHTPYRQLAYVRRSWENGPTQVLGGGGIELMSSVTSTQTGSSAQFLHPRVRGPLR